MVHIRARQILLQLSRLTGRFSLGGRDEQGFSLVELIVIVGIITVLLAVGLPQFKDWRQNQNLKTAAREVVSSFQFARIEAARRDATVTIRITTGGFGTGKCTVFVDNGQGGGTASNGQREGGEPLLREMAIPTGVTLSATTLTTYQLSNRGFTVGGSAGAGTIGLTNGKRSYTVELTAAGAVRLSGPT